MSFQPSFQPAGSAKHFSRAISNATLASARNCTPNVVLSSGTNMFQGAFERMTKDTTVTAPSTMKIRVVAPPDGKIVTVGAKRFHCAEVLPTEVFASEGQCRRVTRTSSVQVGSYLCCCDSDVPCDSRQGSATYCQWEEASYPSCSVQPAMCMLTPCERHKPCKHDRQVTSRT